MLPLNSFIDSTVEMTVRPRDWIIKLLNLKTYEDKMLLKNTWEVSLVFE